MADVARAGLQPPPRAVDHALVDGREDRSERTREAALLRHDPCPTPVEPDRQTRRARDPLERGEVPVVERDAAVRESECAERLAGVDGRGEVVRVESGAAERDADLLEGSLERGGRRELLDTVLDVERVAIDLMLFPRPGSRDGPIAFGIDLVPRKTGWLVDSTFPTAIWSGKGERPFVTGAQDFTGEFGTKQSTYDKPEVPESRLGSLWLLVPGLLLGAAAVAPVVIVVRALVGRRRTRRPLEPLPPLPSTVARRS